MKFRKWTGRIAGGVVLTLAVCGATIFGLRMYNTRKYPVTQASADLHDKNGYPTNDRIRSIEGEYLNGFHFTPQERSHKGTVVVYGGSEGSPAYGQAKALSEQGFEVLALYFFGQDNQKPSLAQVPLEQFNEVVEYAQNSIENPTPITVIGTSKGAEFTANLAAHGYPVDNLINFTPAHYSYSGLDFSSQKEQPSFTHNGEPVPFATFRSGNVSVGMKMMWDMITAYPPEYRPTYENAAEHAHDHAAIDLSSFDGNALFLAGDQDKMWQGEVASKALAEQSPAFESVIYPGAGHLFVEDIESMGNGWQIMFGGTVDGNAKAAKESMDLVTKKLSEWHADK